MMVGEFNFGDLFVKSEVSNNGTTQIMFVLFLVLVSPARVKLPPPRGINFVP
jgi:hypothetical protein